MLDSPEKTRLMATLKAAVPFHVELPPSTLARLKAKNPSLAVKTNETVFSVTYEPSYGGIVCLIRPTGTDDLLATSLTHVRVRGSEPFAPAVLDYQKHRVKKLKKTNIARAHRDHRHRRMQSMMESLRKLRIPHSPGTPLFFFTKRGELRASDPLAHEWRDGNGRAVQLN